MRHLVAGAHGLITALPLPERLAKGAETAFIIPIVSCSRQVWQLTASNSITRIADVAVSGSEFVTSVPGQSVTLFVVPTSAGPAKQPRGRQCDGKSQPGTAPLVVAGCLDVLRFQQPAGGTYPRAKE